jgi:hypothetical protein
LEFWVSLTEMLVNVSILAAAVVAVFKLRVFSLLSRRFRSEVECSHYTLPGGRVVFVGEYTIHNTGERPITLSDVQVRLVGATKAGPVLAADEDAVLAERTYFTSEGAYEGLGRIEAGERSIFPLRCELDELPSTTYLIGSFRWPYKREPASFYGLYVMTDGGLAAEPTCVRSPPLQDTTA